MTATESGPGHDAETGGGGESSPSLCLSWHNSRRKGERTAMLCWGIDEYHPVYTLASDAVCVAGPPISPERLDERIPLARRIIAPHQRPSRELPQGADGRTMRSISHLSSTARSACSPNERHISATLSVRRAGQDMDSPPRDTRARMLDGLTGRSGTLASGVAGEMMYSRRSSSLCDILRYAPIKKSKGRRSPGA